MKFNFKLPLWRFEKLLYMVGKILFTLKRNRYATILILFTIFFSSYSLADGTKQVSPVNNADGGALLSAASLGRGPYLGSNNDKRLRFTISDHTTENLYFGFQPRTYSTGGSALVTDAYYRIYDAADNLIGTFVNLPSSTGAGFIETHAEAVAGPNIGGATPAGYTPFVFDPTANGDYYMVLYRTDDDGTTQDAGEWLTMPFFDLTVATAGNVQSPGRVWCREWSFVATNLSSGNFEQSLASSIAGDFFVYTPDNFKLKLN